MITNLHTIESAQGRTSNPQHKRTWRQSAILAVTLVQFQTRSLKAAFDLGPLSGCTLGSDSGLLCGPGTKEQKSYEGDDRFSGRTTHVSPTALKLAQNAEKSEPIWKNKQSANNTKVNDEIQAET